MKSKGFIYWLIGIAAVAAVAYYFYKKKKESEPEIDEIEDDLTFDGGISGGGGGGGGYTLDPDYSSAPLDTNFSDDIVKNIVRGSVDVKIQPVTRTVTKQNIVPLKDRENAALIVENKRLKLKPRTVLKEEIEVAGIGKIAPVLSTNEIEKINDTFNLKMS